MQVPNIVCQMLERMERPAFLVHDKTIVYCNQHAQNLHIQTDTPIYSLFDTGREAYDAFTEGCLQLQLQLQDFTVTASVEKLEAYQLFLLEQDAVNTKLLTLAMAATQLRTPLSGLMSSMEQNNPQTNRILHQLHRTVSNMSDVMRYATMENPPLRIHELNAWLLELVEAVNTHTDSMHVRVTCKTCNTPVPCPIHEELLKRAILNLISNSIKAGSTQIDIQLLSHKDMVSITLKDNGKGLKTQMQSELFSHFMREPNYEDVQYGIGLGMSIVKAAARIHQGTILTDSDTNGGLRVTLTLSNRQDEPLTLRSPSIFLDYLGGRDTILTELADILPPSEY